MKKLLSIFLIMVVFLTGCASKKEESYKSHIFSLVNDNIQILEEYVSKDKTKNPLAKELSDLKIKETEEITLIGASDIVVFEMYHTGLYDGGVEYGFYYTKGDRELNKTISTNDYMVIEQIRTNWYYYEWHNG